MSQNYGTVGGRKRRRGGSFQWIILGFIPGVFCGVITLIALFVSGVLNLGALQEPPEVPTQVVIVVSATPDPFEPTQEPIVVTATPDVSVDAAVTATPLVLPTEADDQSAQNDQGIVLAPTNTPQIQGNQESTVEQQPIDTSSQSSAENAAQPTTQTDTALQPVPSAPVNVPTGLVPTTLVSVPGGIFTLGTQPNEIVQAVNECTQRDAGTCLLEYGEDSYPPVQVQLSTFQIEDSEVTFEQYAAFLNSLVSRGLTHLNGCRGFACIETQNESENAVFTFDGQNYSFPTLSAQYPVYGVTWYGAAEYCESIGRRLPTEAEWEYAARGQEGFVYPWGNQWSNDLAKTNRSEGDAGPLPVRSFPSGASQFGAYDMAGNVAEWVSDWYTPNYYSSLQQQPQQPVLDPENTLFAVEKVVRGGSWDAVPFFSRTVHRQSRDPQTVNLWIGFRCVEDVDAGAQTSVAPVDSSNLAVDQLEVNTTPIATVETVPDPATLLDSETQTTNAQPGLPTAPAVKNSVGG